MSLLSKLLYKDISSSRLIPFGRLRRTIYDQIQFPDDIDRKIGGNWKKLEEIRGIGGNCSYVF